VTSQGEPAALFLTRDRQRVQEFGVDLNAPCAPNGFMDLPDWIHRFRIRGGRFGDTFAYKDDSGNRRAFRFYGKVTRTRANGTLSMTLTAGDGTVCRTGNLSWTLRSG
jgi:hypothetical protein